MIFKTRQKRDVCWINGFKGILGEVMNKLYAKSEIWFAILWIIIYILGTIILDNVASLLKITNFLTPLFYVLLCAILLIWILKNKLHIKYGLCKSPFDVKNFLFFLPLLVLISINFWYGVKVDMDAVEILLFVVTMICVGFLEEIIFRGFLFKAMEKDSLKWATIVSSLTFGLGHIINLFSANADFLSTMLQVCYATTTGFLFVIIFFKGKTLLPCIFTHSLFNTLSLFAVNVSQTISIITAVVMMVITVAYSIVLIKLLPKQEQNLNGEQGERDEH